MDSEDAYSLSSLMEVRSEYGQGRGYFAKCPVRAGTTVLAKCDAIVRAVNDDHEGRHCR